MKDTDTSVTHVTPADGNIFAELGFEPAEAAKLKIKSGLMIEIRHWVEASKLRQVDAAKILKVSRPRLSDVMTGKIRKFTIDALVDMLENAGLHVTVHVA